LATPNNPTVPPTAAIILRLKIYPSALSANSLRSLRLKASNRGDRKETPRSTQRNTYQVAQRWAIVKTFQHSGARFCGKWGKYVSRGGLKLEKAFEHWKINVTGKICLDVGASTGGFTDCLLQLGAARVIAVDTGHGQIDFRLRQDPRVRLLEKTNARYLTRDQIGEYVDFIAMDVSFISAALVLPAVVAAAFPETP